MSFSSSTPQSTNPHDSHFPEPKASGNHQEALSHVGQVAHDAKAAQDATAELHRQRAEIELDEGVDFFGVRGARARARLERA